MALVVFPETNKILSFGVYNPGVPIKLVILPLAFYDLISKSFLLRANESADPVSLVTLPLP